MYVQIIHMHVIVSKYNYFKYMYVYSIEYIIVALNFDN